VTFFETQSTSIYRGVTQPNILVFIWRQERIFVLIVLQLSQPFIMAVI